MSERLVFYASSGIVTAIAAWIGLVAFLTGLKRFGHNMKFPMWLLFGVLWVVATLAGVVGGSGATDMISLIAAPVLIIGILVYLASLPMGRKKGGEKSK